jgi:mutator protein MutT
MYDTNRVYPEFPLPGVAAIIIHEEKVLLVERGKEPSKGKWGLPGGLVEVGETIEEAIKREVLEETGISIKPIKLLEVLDSIKKNEDKKVQYHYIIFEFLCKYNSGEIKASSDAPNAAWIPLDSLDSVNIMSSTKSFIERILQNEHLDKYKEITV